MFTKKLNCEVAIIALIRKSARGFICIEDLKKGKVFLIKYNRLEAKSALFRILKY